MAVEQHRPAPGETSVRMLERGDIYFFYRPKTDVQVVRGLDDLQRVYMILAAQGAGSYRLLVIGQKRLPAGGEGGGEDRKAWAFVTKVSTWPQEVEDELDPKTLLRKTRGERMQPPARPAGEGVYSIVAHRGHTHLAYVLELPAAPGEVQGALNIAKEGNHIVSVKNPREPSPPDTGLEPEQRASFPRELQQRFKGRRFIPLVPPGFLNHVGAELVLVGTRQNVIEELGIELNPEHETEATAEIFNDLNLEKSLHPIRPLLEGHWE